MKKSLSLVVEHPLDPVTDPLLIEHSTRLAALIETTDAATRIAKRNIKIILRMVFVEPGRTEVCCRRHQYATLFKSMSSF